MSIIFRFLLENVKIFFRFLNFISEYVYIVENDTCACELLIRMGRVKEWERVNKINASNLPFYFS